MYEQIEEHIAKEIIKQMVDNSCYSNRAKEAIKILVDKSKSVQDITIALYIGSLL